MFEEGLFRDALAHAAGAPVDHDGHPLSAASLARLFTEGTLMHRLLLADGQVVDRGRSLRLASPNLRDAMITRDRGCRFPHCDAPTAWVHAHHLQHWENGGRHRPGQPRRVVRHPPRRRPPPRVESVPTRRRHPGLPTTRRAHPHQPTTTTAPTTTPAAAPPPPPRHRPRPPRPTAADADPRECREAGAPDEPSDHETALLVRARVVDLVRRHHRQRPRQLHRPVDAWPDAG